MALKSFKILRYCLILWKRFLYIGKSDSLGWITKKDSKKQLKTTKIRETLFIKLVLKIKLKLIQLNFFLRD